MRIGTIHLVLLPDQAERRLLFYLLDVTCSLMTCRDPCESPTYSHPKLQCGINSSKLPASDNVSSIKVLIYVVMTPLLSALNFIGALQRQHASAGRIRASVMNDCWLQWRQPFSQPPVAPLFWCSFPCKEPPSQGHCPSVNAY